MRANRATQIVRRVVDGDRVSHVAPVKRQQRNHQQERGRGHDDAEDVV
jgi:hypothetical protein